MRRRNLILASLLVISAAIGTFIYIYNPTQPLTIAQMDEAEKSRLDSSGAFHYHSPMRLPDNPGLPVFLANSRDNLLKKNPNGNFLFLMIHKPATPNEWSDIVGIGRKLVSFITTRQPIDVGHVQWAWSCKVQGERHEGASGYTGEQQDQAISLAIEGWGATAALLTYNDGYFEPPWVVQVRAAHAVADENFRLRTVIVDEKSCGRFLSKYSELRFKSPLIGFKLADPIGSPIPLSSGSNCSNVAASLFSEIAGFPMETFTESRETWRIPKALFGMPNKNLPGAVALPTYWKDFLKDREGVSVNLVTALTQAQTCNDTVAVQFTDPQKLFSKVGDLPEVLNLLDSP